jgi:hypothetical protein
MTRQKAIWDSIDDKLKNIILGYTTSSPSVSSFTTRRGKPLNTSFNKSAFKYRKALLHEFLEAFEDDVEEVQEEVTADDAPLSADLEPDPPADLLINAMKGSNPSQLPAGDISIGLCPKNLNVLYTRYV